MGMMVVEAGGREFRWYDNGGSIHAPGGEIIGWFTSPDSLWLFPEDDHANENRRKAEDYEIGHVRAIALSWLKSQGGEGK